MIRQLTTRGLPGIEHGALIAARNYKIEIAGYTVNRNMANFGLILPNILERHNILEKNRNITQGSIIFNIDNKFNEKLETFLDYCNYDHHVYSIRNFDIDELKNIVNWINYNDISKINIHGHNGYEDQSFNFFMKMFEKC